MQHSCRVAQQPGHHPRRAARHATHRCRRHAAPPVAAHATLPAGALQPTAAGEAAKTALLERLKRAPDRGIFGLSEAERREVDGLTQALEAHTPLPGPTAHLRGAVAGAWRLLYTTVTIRGGTRTKLGLRGALTLGELQQVISCDDGDADASGEAVNDVAFSLVGAVRGHFTVRARYNIASPTRVAITYSDSTLEPQQLQAIFGDQMPLLLSIFNPEGWLDITYIDDTLRVGRDDKGNTFVLERMT